MKASELKRMIKECVRECMQEIFAENYLQGVVKAVMLEAKAAPQPVACQPVRQIEPERKKQLREDILKKMGLNPTDPMTSLFEDTLASNNQILASNPIESAGDGVEQISEATMEKAGIFARNWDRFL
jgi:formylmethanofuran:tetrahydromethanopterin formyltransferase